jgi:hypothetical protein
MDRELFEIKIVESYEYQIIVFSKDSSTISDYISDVAKKLSERHYRGHVLFDLLLSNGLDDRYYVLNFNGNSFDYKTLHKLANTSYQLLNISNRYYKEHIRLLKSSILNKYQKNEFIKLLKTHEFGLL